MDVVRNALRILAFSVFAALACSPVAAQSPAALNDKYLKAAGITKLDGLLLRAEVENFAGPIRWDDHHLINSVVLYHAHPELGLVGMTFLVNKESYIALRDDVAKNVFADVVVGACNILKSTIPEIEKGANEYANFTLIGGDGIVAEYKNGKVSLTK
jgi:hypothetical protein